jgi:hypothetical protein
MQIFKSLTKQIEKTFAEIKKYNFLAISFCECVCLCVKWSQKRHGFFKLILTDICSYII